MQRQLPIASRPGEGCTGWGQRLSAKTLSSSSSPSAPPHLGSVTSPSTFSLARACESLLCATSSAFKHSHTSGRYTTQFVLRRGGSPRCRLSIKRVRDSLGSVYLDHTCSLPPVSEPCISTPHSSQSSFPGLTHPQDPALSCLWSTTLLAHLQADLRLEVSYAHG